LIRNVGRGIGASPIARTSRCNVAALEGHLLLNAVECMPENEVLILLEGNGARPEAVSWLSREASQINSKRIFVLNVNEFTGWVRREFVRFS
jgi:hypothetical protein